MRKTFALALFGVWLFTAANASGISLKYADIGRAPYTPDAYFSNIDIGGISPLMSSDELIKTFKEQGYTVKESQAAITVVSNLGPVTYERALVAVTADKITTESEDHFVISFGSPSVGSNIQSISRKFRFHYAADQQRIKVEDFMVEVEAKYGEPTLRDGNNRRQYCIEADGTKYTGEVSCSMSGASIFLGVDVNSQPDPDAPDSQDVESYAVDWANMRMGIEDLEYLKTAGGEFIKRQNELKSGRVRPKPKSGL